MAIRSVSILISVSIAGCAYISDSDAPCVSDSECPTNYSCGMAGKCVAGAPAGTPDTGPVVDSGMQPADSGPADSGPASCTSDNQCAGSPATPACDRVSGQCVQCNTAANCNAPSLMLCTPGNTCAYKPGDCGSDADCAALGTTRKCDTSDNVCVGCLTSQDCPAGQSCNGAMTCVASQVDSGPVDSGPTDTYCNPCTTNTSCGFSVVDGGAVENICVSGGGPGFCIPACSTSADCPSSALCLSLTPDGGTSGLNGGCIPITEALGLSTNSACTVSGLGCALVDPCTNLCPSSDPACSAHCIAAGSPGAQNLESTLDACATEACPNGDSCVSDAGSMCTQTCFAAASASGGACSAPYNACYAEVSPDGGFPDAGVNSAHYCHSCTEDSQCGGGPNDAGTSTSGNYCVPLTAGASVGVCGTACASNANCPTGASCVPVTDQSGYSWGNVCLPTADACPGQTDAGPGYDGGPLTGAMGTLCHGDFVNPVTAYATDPDNCGACGNACPTGVACVNSQCSICTPAVASTRTASLLTAAISLPNIAAGLNIAGFDGGTGLSPPWQTGDVATFQGLTLDHAQNIDCQGTPLGQYFGNGDFAMGWGSNNEVVLDSAGAPDFTSNYLGLNFGYQGELDFGCTAAQCNTPSPRAYKMSLDGTPIQVSVNGAAYATLATLDWTDAATGSPTAMKPFDNIYRALMATFTTLPPDPTGVTCDQIGACQILTYPGGGICSTGSNAPGAVFFVKDLGWAFWVQPDTDPADAVTPCRMDLYLQYVVTTLTISPASPPMILPGTLLQFSVDATLPSSAMGGAGGTIDATGQADWYSSDNTIATFNGTAPGQLLALAGGTVTVTVTDDNASATETVIIVTPPDAGTSDAGSVPALTSCATFIACLQTCQTPDCENACSAQASATATSDYGNLANCIFAACPTTTPDGGMGVCATASPECSACQTMAQSTECVPQTTTCVEDTSGQNDCFGLLYCCTNFPCQASCLNTAGPASQNAYNNVQDCLYETTCPVTDGGVCASMTATACQNCLSTAESTGACVADLMTCEAIPIVDGGSGGTCSSCDSNATCTNSNCICNSGYSGDGSVCTATDAGTPCTSDTQCSSPTSACNTTTGYCVQCTTNIQCSGATPVCNAGTNTCIAAPDAGSTDAG